ncbi:MAG: TIGR04219 family outer membrane beta-barrel protein [Sulfuricurvum sp.]
MFKKSLLALSLSASMASAAMLLGFGAEADYYAPVASGTFGYTSNGTTSATHFDSTSQGTYQVGAFFEHPVPLIPNIRIDATPRTSFTGSNGALGTNTVSINQTDITPYYEILDNVVELDIGVTLKVLDVTVGGTANQTLTQAIPMGYVAGAINLVGTGLHLMGNVKYLGHNSDYFMDGRVKAVLDISKGFQAEVGYRQESLQLNNHFGVTSDVKIQGPFAGLAYTF